MPAFNSHRVTREYIQTNPATPEKLFPLICPVREADWLPGWQYRLIYSDSGVAERGCVFTTPAPTAQNPDAEITWIVTEFDPSTFRIVFVWINPGSVLAEIRIQLTPDGHGNTRTHIRYRYTGLSPDGNREIERYDQNWFAAKMQNWEININHYLRTGKTMAGPERE